MAAHARSSDRSGRRPGDADAISVAYLSTYPPRECGLANFCEDLIQSTLACGSVREPIVIAMENSSHHRDYGWPVTLIVSEMQEGHYEAAAHYLNQLQVDVVSVQHEFGIFGGCQAPGLYRFLHRLAKPVVTTLHTVTPAPEPQLRARLRDVADRSQRLVVMNALAIDILAAHYGIDRRKISLVHHGAPSPSSHDREEIKARLGLSGRRVLSTFGLVGRGKGMEYALAALPDILRDHPDVCYVVAGQTHPGLQRVEKESYRGELVRLVNSLRIQDSVRFVNRYLTRSEIADYLAATDIYITPYLNPHQITSGTLAYAVAAGRAIISTPYLYARFILGEERGLLADFRSEESIAAAANRVLDNPDLQRVLEVRNRAYGERMVWPAVAAQYVELFRRVARDHRAAAPRTAYTQLQFPFRTPIERKPTHEADRSRPSSVTPPLAAAD